MYIRAFLFLFLLIISWATYAQQEGRHIEHKILFQQNGKYGGWPANHGVWVWEDEILVGFVAASYKQSNAGLHTYDPSTAESHYARSLDGGETWSIQDAYSLGQKAWGHDNNISKN